MVSNHDAVQERAVLPPPPPPSPAAAAALDDVARVSQRKESGVTTTSSNSTATTTAAPVSTHEEEVQHNESQAAADLPDSLSETRKRREQTEPERQKTMSEVTPEASEKSRDAHDSAESMYSLSSSSTLQDFEKLGLLGTGGAAVVHLVRHRATRQTFAMKVQQVAPEDPTSRQSQRAFKELQILRALQHPFVARLHDAFQDGSTLCLVLEFYEGGTLENVQNFCGGSLTEAEARFYAAELVLALEYVHTMGVVYRDLKPQNVLVHRDGHIRLTDFGVAQHGDHFASQSDDQQFSGIHHYGADDRVRLRSTSFVGTMDYMSPEMIQQKPQSTDVDWWTLGCLLYELLFGAPPFDRRTDNQESADEVDPASLFKEILRCRVVFPASPTVSDDCKDFLRSLLEKCPEKRLGHRCGAWELKQHRFFRGTQWALVGHRPAPVVVATPAISPITTLCFQQSHAGNLGDGALQPLTTAEQALPGACDSGASLWARHSLAKDYGELSLAQDDEPARSPSAASNPEDTCDEELDRVLISIEQRCSSVCDKTCCSRGTTTATKYQRSLLFETRTLHRSKSSSFIDSMLSRRRPDNASAAVFRTKAPHAGREGAGEPSEPQSGAQELREKSAWTILADKAAAFLN